jgi:hypothetical protein
VLRQDGFKGCVTHGCDSKKKMFRPSKSLPWVEKKSKHRPEFRAVFRQSTVKETKYVFSVQSRVCANKPYPR